jgi:hypothetical protein
MRQFSRAALMFAGAVSAAAPAGAKQLQAADTLGSRVPS